MTWDSYVRRGGSGPSGCHLCFEEVETMDHLMVQCFFSKKLWEELRNIIWFPLIWGSLNVINNFDSQRRGAKRWLELPCFICLDIWKQRNVILFENKGYFFWKVVTRVKSLFSFYVKEEKQSTRRIPQPPSFNFLRPSRFFNGSSQERDWIYGVGSVLLVDEEKHYKMIIGCGKGSNTRG